MCCSTLFSACGSLVDKLTCSMRCANWRFCTKDHIEVNINGSLDDRSQQVALSALGKDDSLQRENDILPAPLMQRLLKILPGSKGSSQRADRPQRQAMEDLAGIGVTLKEEGPVLDLPRSVLDSAERLIKMLSGYERASDDLQKKALFYLGVFRLNVILQKRNISRNDLDEISLWEKELKAEAQNLIESDSAIYYLFFALKTEKTDPSALQGKHCFTQEMIDTIKKLPYSDPFLQDLEECKTLVECSVTTILHLWEIAQDSNWRRLSYIENKLKNYNLLFWLKDVAAEKAVRN